MARLPKKPAAPWYRWYEARSPALSRAARAWWPAELVEASQKVTDDDDLFEDGVRRSGQHEHRDPPPCVGQAGRHHREAGTELVGEEVPGKPDAAHCGGGTDPDADVRAPMVCAQPERRQRFPRVARHHEYDRHRQEEADDPDQLEGEVEQRSSRRHGTVQDCGLGRQTRRRQKGSDKGQDRAEPRQPDGKSDHDQGLQGQQTTARRGKEGRRGHEGATARRGGKCRAYAAGPPARQRPVARPKGRPCLERPTVPGAAGGA